MTPIPALDALRRRLRIRVDVSAGPDAHDRFSVYVDGGMQRWGLARITDAIERGHDVQERGR